MNVAVLTGPEDDEIAGPLLEAIGKAGVSAYGLRIRDSWRHLKPSVLLSYYEKATHTLAVCSEAGLASSWLAFSAGFAYGKRLKMALYRMDAHRALPEFLSRLPVIDTLEELEAFYAAERIDWERDESRTRAREELFELGLSFTVDSLAKGVADADLHAVELFMKAGMSPDAKDARGVPMLSHAVREKRLGMLEYLCDMGADIDQPSDDRGYTPLMDAVASGETEIVSFLLGRGASVAGVSKDGQNALVIAVGRNDASMARMLLERGADPDLPDKLGLSARKYAKLFRDGRMLEVFGAAGASTGT